MSGRRARRIVAFLALALMLALAMFVGMRWHRLHTAAVTRHQHAATVSAPPTPKSPSAASMPLQPPLSAVTARDPSERWIAHTEQVILRKRAHRFNADAARLAAAPPAQAWRDLTAAADDGDIAAATLATQLAVECDILRSMDDASESRFAVRREQARATLPAAWGEWLNAIDRRLDQRRTERRDDCAAVGGTLTFASLMLDRLLNSSDPDTQLFLAEETPDDTEAIAMLRALAAQSGSEQAQRALGERLLRAGDPEGLQVLVGLTDQDEDIVDFLAHCYHDGCDGFPADPPTGAAWIDRAADDGNLMALGWQIDDATARNDIPAAWAWSMYRLQLAIDSCFQYSNPDTTWLQRSVENAATLDQRLAPAQRAQALEELQALGQRWFATAEQNLDCGT